jgi:hypothetical protein
MTAPSVSSRYPTPAPLPKSSLTHCPSELAFHSLNAALGIAYFVADSESEPGKLNVVGLDTQTGESLCSCRAGEVGRDCWHRALVQAAWDGHRARPALAIVQPVPTNVRTFRVHHNPNRDRLNAELFG